MSSHEQDLINDKTYIALGRFVVSFSHLLNALEESTVWLFGLGPDYQRSLLIKAALSDRTAFPISSSFFSVFFEKWGEEIKDEDARIMKALRKEVQDLIEKRNRVMHDAWMSRRGGGKSAHPMTTMRVRAHGKGAEYEFVEVTPEEVVSLADTAKRLSGIVTGITFYARPGMRGPEVHERYEIINNRVFSKPDNPLKPIAD